ncbi:Predicted dehydrogenase [Sphingobium faniae]|nr:Predicted dehydrogenase [Sphingobium faniae]
MATPIGIGIIGGSPERGWALDAHLPAIKASPDLELRAVSTSRKETALKATEAFGVPAYDNAAELVARDDVDLVVVNVKVPHHFELVSAAIDAGKAVFCEWPLGNGLEETSELARKANAAGVRNFIGLQARSGPEFNHIRQLIADGYVGEVLSSSIVASGANWGAQVEQCNAYCLDARSGASMLMIPVGHTMDGVCYCLGEVAHLSADMAIRRTQSHIVDTGGIQPMTVPDQILVSGQFQSGAMLSIHYRGGMSTGTNFLWEINGTEGDLTITAAYGLAEMTPLHVSGAKAGEAQAPIVTPDSFVWASGNPEGVALNVAQAYSLIVEDLRDGGKRAPDFNHAVLRHRMLSAMEKAAATGQRQTYL